MDSDLSRPDGEHPEGGSPSLFERLVRGAFLAFLLAVPVYLVGVAVELNLNQPHRDAYHIDFVAFWAAAKLAVAGEAVAAFDQPTLAAAQSLPPEDIIYAQHKLFWHYPPGFHLLLAPLGYLGFSPALAIFTLCALGAYVLALRGWTRDLPLGRYLAVVAPPVGFVLATGNASLLWAAALLVALAHLFRGRELAAGAMIALLTLKPQLGLMIPVALIAAGYWRTILWASAATAALVALTLAVFGAEYWMTFFHTMLATSGRAAADVKVTETMVTWYALLRNFGVGHDAALTAQLIALAAAAAAVFAVWRRRSVDDDLKAAVLCLATLTATPYAYQYELILGVLAMLFLLRAGFGRNLAERLWLAALWVLPVPGWQFVGLEIAHYAAAVVSLSLVLSIVAALRTPAPALAAQR